jgi:protocatechuate 3,4-dioxygenase beta subunit
LNSLLEAVISRRTLLVGTVGAAFAAAVAACTGRSPAGIASPSAVATPTCIVTPAETEGPYFVDERLNRSDITTDPSGGSARPGVPLTITFNVARVGSSGCTALAGAHVDVWHCDALGVYSDVAAQGTVGRRYLRGYQLTDGGGVATFKTIYPGWYSGRAVHIHFKVRTFGGGSKTYEFTSQLFFDEAITDAVYQQSPYNSRPGRDTRNATDSVYRSNNTSGSMLIASVKPSGSGYAATFGIGLNLV